MPASLQTTHDSQHAAGASLQDSLLNEWRSASAGDSSARSRWECIEGGDWTWEPKGVLIRSNGAEWSAFHSLGFGSAEITELKNFIVELSIDGEAEAAGLSFGPYKDFLAEVGPHTGRRRLQLEIDCVARRWAFRTDGQLMYRQWWDSAVHTVDDLISGKFTLKARRARTVLFHDFSIRLFESSCQLSVILTCNRFGHRLRVCLRNWCNQTLSSGAYQILVVNPGSPDGVHELLAAVASSHPHVRVREVSVPSVIASNKGAMINRAVESASAPWIWLTDADCLFSTRAAQEVLTKIEGRTNHLFYGQRKYLSSSVTDSLIAGRLDSVSQFDSLVRDTESRTVENSPWGYTQIFHRSIFDRIKYRETVNHFAHSDGFFVEDCRRAGITTELLRGLFCLHLDHPFSWFGTKVCL